MRYYLKKLGGLLTTLLLLSMITFGVFQLLSGNPAQVMLGIDADPAQVERLEEELGLNDPAYIRYGRWVMGALTGDFGMSYRYDQPVSDLIGDAFWVTAGLSLYAMVLTLLIGLPLGLFLAGQKNPVVIWLGSIVSQLGLSVPYFCTGILLISIFSVNLNWFPSFGYTPWSEGALRWIHTMTLPAVAIAVGASAILMRYVKVSIERERGKDYVKTALSKGLRPGQILRGHILRNSLIPVITMMGVLVTDIFGSSIIIETVFSLPGLGKLIATAIEVRDLPLIQGLVLCLAVIVVLCNFLVDMLYSVVDPRIRVK